MEFFLTLKLSSGQLCVLSSLLCIEQKKGRASARPFSQPSSPYARAPLAAFFLSAQRFFIISEMRCLAAALKRRRPRLPRPRPGPAGTGPGRRPRRPPPPSRADIACSRRSLSSLSAAIICCVSIWLLRGTCYQAVVGNSNRMKPTSNYRSLSRYSLGGWIHRSDE